MEDAERLALGDQGKAHGGPGRRGGEVAADEPAPRIVHLVALAAAKRPAVFQRDRPGAEGVLSGAPRCPPPVSGSTRGDTGNVKPRMERASTKGV